MLLRGEPVAWNPIKEQVAPTVQGSRVAGVHVWAYSSPQGQAEQRRNRRRDDTAADPGIEVIFFSVWGSADEDVRPLDRYGLPAAARFAALRYTDKKRVRSVIWV